MIGGLIKSNRMAAIAGAGIIAGALSVSPAQAADFGGDCCADLEERVAVLEATTARKGNRKVSLTISGWVNTAVMIWDDGVDSDAYVVSDNGNTLSSRFTFAGNAKINHDWSAGYNITIEVLQDDVFLGQVVDAIGAPNTAAQNFVDDNGGAPTILYSYMYVKSERLGTVSWGRQSQATDNIIIVDHSGTLFSGNPVVFRGNSFNIRGTNALWSDVLACSGLNGAGIGVDCTGEPANVLKYESPALAGFTLAASWGEDDFWDVGLKYAGEFGDIKVAAAIGYSETDDQGLFPGHSSAFGEAQILSIGASLMHVPTGLFISGAYENQDSPTLVKGESDSYYVKAGIKQKWNSLGATAIYGEWAEYNDTANVVGVCGSGASPCIAAQQFAAGTDTETTRYGVGLHQWIDAASMQLYAKWDHLEAEVNGADFGEELDTFTFGGVIFF